MSDNNLEYRAITLYIPYSNEDGTLSPEDWDYTSMLDAVAPVFVCGTEPVSNADMKEIFETNGLHHLIDELVPEKELETWYVDYVDEDNEYYNTLMFMAEDREHAAEQAMDCVKGNDPIIHPKFIYQNPRTQPPIDNPDGIASERGQRPHFDNQGYEINDA